MKFTVRFSKQQRRFIPSFSPDGEFSSMAEAQIEANRQNSNPAPVSKATEFFQNNNVPSDAAAAVKRQAEYRRNNAADESDGTTFN